VLKSRRRLVAGLSVEEHGMDEVVSAEILQADHLEREPLETAGRALIAVTPRRNDGCPFL
jgi:hypothetical protein